MADRGIGPPSNWSRVSCSGDWLISLGLFYLPGPTTDNSSGTRQASGMSKQAKKPAF